MSARDDNTLRICSWNILAAAYGRKNAHTHCDPDALSWESRGPRILQHIGDTASDILCLQEVDQYEDFMSDGLTALGYSHSFTKRTGGKVDGCVTAWKSDKFEEVSRWDVVFDQLADEVALRTPMQDFSDYFRTHNIAQIICLRRRSSASLSTNGEMPAILVANAHIFWNPKHEIVKLAQVNLLMDQVSRCRAQILSGRIKSVAISYTPIIICGDFNSTPESRVYKFMTGHAIEIRSSETFSTSRVLLDTPLLKLAKMLRAVGWDTVHFADGGNHSEMFRVAREDKRVIISSSAKKLARRDCPPSLLVHSNQIEDAFKEIVCKLGIQFDSSKFYMRCLECNTPFRQITPQQASVEPSLPFKISENDYLDRQGRLLDFYKCDPCSQVYWFGDASKSAMSRYKSVFDDVESFRHEWMAINHPSQIPTRLRRQQVSKNDSKAEDTGANIDATKAERNVSDESELGSSDDFDVDETIVSGVANDAALDEPRPQQQLQDGNDEEGDEESVHSVLVVQMQRGGDEEKSPVDEKSVRRPMTFLYSSPEHALFDSMECHLQHSLKLRSVYAEYNRFHNKCDGAVNAAREFEPDFTNFTVTFQDTIDFIFVSQDDNVSIVNVDALPTADDIRKETAIPTQTWPSDHLCLGAVIKFA